MTASPLRKQLSNGPSSCSAQILPLPMSEMGTAKVCPAYSLLCVSSAGQLVPSNTCFRHAIPLVSLQFNQTGLSAFLSAEAALYTPGLTYFMVN